MNSEQSLGVIVLAGVLITTVLSLEGSWTFLDVFVTVTGVIVGCTLTFRGSMRASALLGAFLVLALGVAHGGYLIYLTLQGAEWSAAIVGAGLAILVVIGFGISLVRLQGRRASDLSRD